MTRRRVNILSLAVLVVLLVAGAWGWWYLNVGRFPLAGKLSHNYGIIEIYGRSASAEHVFHLRNRVEMKIVKSIDFSMLTSRYPAEHFFKTICTASSGILLPRQAACSIRLCNSPAFNPVSLSGV